MHTINLSREREEETKLLTFVKKGVKTIVSFRLGYIYIYKRKIHNILATVLKFRLSLAFRDLAKHETFP